MALGALCLAAPPLHAQPSKADDSMIVERGAALVYGPRHALTLHAPDGWVLDEKSGRAQGLQAVFYPRGEAWATSPAVMYCAVVPRGGQIRDLAAMLEYEANRFHNASPSAAIIEQPAIVLPKNRRATVRRLSGGVNGALEQVAYVEESTVIVMVVLSSRTPETFSKALPAFTALVGSYHFLSDDPENIQRAVEAAEDQDW
ncbi:MAG TPA: hypothetical protein VHI13_14790 [Candidatus Kapabacteria bacterium]|nr:hypothetical protein [Candidatus Kapabacteria bacterium]